MIAVCTRIGEAPPILWVLAAEVLRMAPGCTAVEMWPVAHDMGGIIIPDKFAKRMRTQVGTVLSAGQGVDVSPGDVAIVHPLDGQWIDGFGVGAYEAQGEVRLYGVMCEKLGEPISVPWDESLLAKIEADMIVPLGHNMTLKMPERREKRGEVYLPNRMQDREDRATVLDVGSRLERTFKVGGEFRTLQPGDVVRFHRRALRQIGFDEDDSVAVIHEDGIYLVESE